MSEEKKTSVKRGAKAQSVATQSITAINKAEKVVESIKTLPEVFKLVSENVVKLKEDLDLGLQKHEVDIKEKMETATEKHNIELKKLDDDYRVKVDINDEAIKILEKNKEEKEYEHKIAIKRNDIQLAEQIAKNNKSIILPEDALIKIEAGFTAKEKEYKKEAAISQAKEVRKVKEEQKETIDNLSVDVKLLTKDVEALSKEVLTKEGEIAYLKGQLEAERLASIERLAAAKADINQVNEATNKR